MLNQDQEAWSKQPTIRGRPVSLPHGINLREAMLQNSKLKQSPTTVSSVEEKSRKHLLPRSRSKSPMGQRLNPIQKLFGSPHRMKEHRSGSLLPFTTKREEDLLTGSSHHNLSLKDRIARKAEKLLNHKSKESSECIDANGVDLALTLSSMGFCGLHDCICEALKVKPGPRPVCTRESDCEVRPPAHGVLCQLLAGREAQDAAEASPPTKVGAVALEGGDEDLEKVTEEAGDEFFDSLENDCHADTDELGPWTVTLILGDGRYGVEVPEGTCAAPLACVVGELLRTAMLEHDPEVDHCWCGLDVKDEETSELLKISANLSRRDGANRTYSIVPHERVTARRRGLTGEQSMPNMDMEELKGKNMVKETVGEASFCVPNLPKTGPERFHCPTTSVPWIGEKERVEPPSNCWEEPASEEFKVRGKHYLTDGKKVSSVQSGYMLLGIDLLLSSTPHTHLSARPNGFVQRFRKSREGAGKDPAPFVLVFHFLLPWGSFLAYFCPRHGEPSPYIGDDVFDNGMRRLLEDEDDEFRNNRIKIIPKCCDGPWIARSTIGGKPAIIGTKIKQSYYRGEGYFEIETDICSSMAALYILGVVKNYCRVVSVELGFVVQGEEESELPERLLTCLRFHHLDVAGAMDFDKWEARP